MSPAEMKAFVANHFDCLTNNKDVSAIERNVRRDYIDHNGPGNQRSDLDKSRERASSTLKRLKDLKVEIRDILADGDKIVVRNVWTAFDPDLADRIKMHGFVLFRIEEGQLVPGFADV